MPDPLWKKALQFLPVPCIDIIFEQPHSGAILLGYRKIAPYKNVWALVGGRMLYGESLRNGITRIAQEYGMSCNGELYLIGVFPVAFQWRSDVAVAVAAPNAKGLPHAEGKEFSRFAWKQTLPKNTGGNYKLMVKKWRAVRKSKEFFNLNRI
jgi:ADP-ribose pyrophosphatase YjhB (NUDIX family)